MTLDIQFIEEEVHRINAWKHEGDMEAEVKSDMGKWAKATGVWGQMHYRDIVLLNAEQRGWTQKDLLEWRCLMTVNQLRKILRENGVEYYIKKEKGCIAKIHVLVEEEEKDVTTG